MRPSPKSEGNLISLQEAYKRIQQTHCGEVMAG